MATRRSLRTTFSFALGLTMVASLTMVGGGLVELWRIRFFVEDDLERMAIVPRLGEQLRQLQAVGNQYVLDGDEPNLAKLRAAGDRCSTDLQALRELAEDGERRREVARLIEAIALYRRGTEFLGSVAGGKIQPETPEMQQRFEEDRREAEHTIEELAGSLYSTESQRSAARLAQVRGRFRRLTGVLAAVLVLLLLAFGLAWRWGGRLVSRLTLLIREIRRIARTARFDVRLPEVGKDELRDLAVAFNSTLAAQQESVTRLMELLGHVTEAAGRIDTVTRAVTEGAAEQHRGAGVATHVVEQVTSRIQDNASAVAQVAKETTEGARLVARISDASRAVSTQAVAALAAVEETAVSVDQMARSVGQVTMRAQSLSGQAVTTLGVLTQVGLAIRDAQDGTAETARLCSKVVEQAALGVASMRRNIEGIGRIHDETLLVAGVVGALADRVDRIGQVVAVIEEVADKTSLLALNASIIAASAGEAGRGFAVVAEEIKELAGRTRLSTSEIAEVVRAIQSGTHEALSASQRSAAAVDHGVELAQETEITLGTILGSARSTQELTTRIALSTEEQTRRAAQVKDTVEEVATAAQSIAQATRGQSTEAEQIRRNVGKLREAMQLVEQRSGEQEVAARQVATAIESIGRKMSTIDRANADQTGANSRVLAAVRGIVEVAERYKKLVETLKEAVRDLGQERGSIEAEVAELRAPSPLPPIEAGMASSPSLPVQREPSTSGIPLATGDASSRRASVTARRANDPAVPRFKIPHGKTPRLHVRPAEDAVPEHVPWEHTPPLKD